MEILPIRLWRTWFQNRFGGRLRQNTASGEEELCQVVCLIVVFRRGIVYFFSGNSDTMAKQYSLVARKNEISEKC